ncbi:MAG TPA: hypothetical protein VGK37_02750 [Casimicrobiaceae bacterium]|jgi:hypothetical protein
MNIEHKPSGFDRSTGKRKALLAAVVLTAAMLGAGIAEADNTKPEPKPAESVTLNFGKLTIEYENQTSGPSIVLQGVLHLVSKALLSQAGAPVGFTLHGNLADASAASADGSQSYVAIGADGMPAECDPSAPCAPPFWTLTFRLVPVGSGHGSSLYFDLTVIPQYDANGTLLSACLVGQDGCEPPDQLE